jgi:hypothetical protein
MGYRISRTLRVFLEDRLDADSGSGEQLTNATGIDPRVSVPITSARFAARRDADSSWEATVTTRCQPAHRRSACAGGTSYISCYVGPMADTITFRPDEDAARALAALTRDGTPVSTAVRAALIDAARERARSVLRAEAEALAADEQDRAEAAQVLRDMESLRAW